jgi:transposase InsO family protein
VHDILRRHGRIVAPGIGNQAYQRFEKPAPNLLWQMDFKGHVPLSGGGRCHPLTIVDDHSRYAVGLQACGNEQAATVQGRLQQVFRRYGLPEAFFVDNGTPWGDASGQRWTRLGVWLLKLGIEVLHSRPYHPQSRGKNERFHRTLKAEVLALRRFHDLTELQHAFDLWRTVYNLDRPHQALDQEVPASRYRPSARAMPDRLPDVEYDDGELVRRVGTTKAYISFNGRLWKVPEAFCGESLAIRPQPTNGQYTVSFGAHQIATIDLTQTKCVGDVPGQVSVMSPG